MARRRAVGVVAAVLLLGGYGVADAADVLPGVLTTSPAPAAPMPYPDVQLPGDLVAPVVAGPDADAPVPTTAALRALAEDVAADHRMAGSFSMVVADVLTGETLLDRDGGAARLPASSLKVLTAAAALDALGPERTLKTVVVPDGAGRVVLVGAGDVLLAEGEGNPATVEGRAGLADLAAQTAAALADQGVSAVEVGLDDTLFTGPQYAADVSGIDLTFVMPVQPVAVLAGRAGSGFVADPALEAAQAFAAALTSRGVEVTGVRRTPAPADAEPLASVSSAPVGEVVRQMLKVSDNSLAEVLARLVAVERGAPADFAGATASVLAQLGALGVDVSGVHLTDASGLSAQNRVPPSVIVEVLLTAMDPETTSLHGLVPALPVGGLDGTLAGRLTDDGAGRVRAKTGTLIQAISLSGTVVTEDGRLLAFAVLTDGIPAGAALQGRLATDAWAEQLAACGCS
ncbi:D-alanyl-D-alanine carboxypeptidase/D-alanyl-D-alanine-endopeptidase [Georgenia yuyongxinii]|uniref:D-alanyl-D-alanine carboxypeptidase/D-alanyl-D-alanine-endopeptidase n=1 Tax=Georgenia yuyongxinii TaxID=2589797 RepID=A0A5B8C912_9MICO|nr:D-alanyl-D-alanine carboxypeptidase/D-alanyl-D-alanine-endopeptidase [Georgenia yuyongxinii]QDC26011.1 D-alanyl-D-alanine carboxypeptidase/D-alanyl-D-alanine-endopeptidase [Georgenia yuyongxinii]